MKKVLFTLAIILVASAGFAAAWDAMYSYRISDPVFIDFSFEGEVECFKDLDKPFCNYDISVGITYCFDK